MPCGPSRIRRVFVDVCADALSSVPGDCPRESTSVGTPRRHWGEPPIQRERRQPTFNRMHLTYTITLVRVRRFRHAGRSPIEATLPALLAVIGVSHISIS